MRRPFAVPLSIALHVAVLYAIGLVPWAASEIPAPPAPTARVFWVDQPLPTERSLDPTEAALARVVPPPEPVESPRSAIVAEPAPPVAPLEPRAEPEPAEPQSQPQSEAAPVALPPPAQAERERPDAPEAPTRRAADVVGPAVPETPTPRAADVREPAAPGGAEPTRTPEGLPEVDWEKERLDAVRDVLNQRATQREYLTFSLDDLVEEEPEPAEPVPLPLVVDDCVIVKGRLARFAALMMGRCVREARSDLFAAIKPAYLKARPVCIETRPDNPGSFLSDGRRISTVKCELVAAEDEP